LERHKLKKMTSPKKMITNHTHHCCIYSLFFHSSFYACPLFRNRKMYSTSHTVFFFFFHFTKEIAKILKWVPMFSSHSGNCVWGKWEREKENVWNVLAHNLGFCRKSVLEMQTLSTGPSQWQKTKQNKKHPTFHFNMDLHIPNTFRPMRRDSSTKHEDKLGSYDLMPNAKSYGLFSDNKG